MFYLDGKEVKPGTPEADAIAERVWKNLIQCYQMDKGLEVTPWEDITVIKKGQKT